MKAIKTSKGSRKQLDMTLKYSYYLIANENFLLFSIKCFCRNFRPEAMMIIYRIYNYMVLSFSTCNHIIILIYCILIQNGTITKLLKKKQISCLIITIVIQTIAMEISCYNAQVQSAKTKEQLLVCNLPYQKAHSSVESHLQG